MDLYDRRDCKASNCPDLKINGSCKRHGKESIFFSCPFLDIWQARHEAGLTR